MELSDNLKKSILPIMGSALIASVLSSHIGYVDGTLIGVGIGAIAIGIIKAVKVN